eukprot:gnl/MRDRNA2_/MRDRNA2_81366_c0_seq4.p1 gnl/MRDRNA2_/MRDRNA2_81366_c0~~gnl/MRDRNA2_/MRDRNA2_81366_c0_seq4.p1  ORF type:complete len:291 (+),score=75.63 gnl/MRDRNA2_/MRDRNA2_81366_c0_seq4:90-962(+)
MASFIESALLKMSSEKSVPFEERLGSLVKQLDSKATAAASEPTCTSSTPNTPAAMASVLLELTEVASQLAHVEMMLSQVTENGPEEESAKRYHEISLKALECSKKMLHEKQAQCLKDLGALVACPGKIIENETKTSVPSTPTSATWDSWTKAELEAVPEFVPEPQLATKLIGSGSLRQDLELLRQRDPECVIIVRRIKKLGFESPQLLDQHFSQYGGVKELLVAHSHVKPTAKRPNGRVRPAALGFVVMATEEGAQNAFKAGTEQWLHGVNIELAPFESFDAHYAEEEDH